MLAWATAPAIGLEWGPEFEPLKGCREPSGLLPRGGGHRDGPHPLDALDPSPRVNQWGHRRHLRQSPRQGDPCALDLSYPLAVAIRIVTLFVIFLPIDRLHIDLTEKRIRVLLTKPLGVLS
jgi:hypothetical protein